jgi:hypothetical protein
MTFEGETPSPLKSVVELTSGPKESPESKVETAGDQEKEAPAEKPDSYQAAAEQLKAMNIASEKADAEKLAAVREKLNGGITRTRGKIDIPKEVESAPLKTAQEKVSNGEGSEEKKSTEQIAESQENQPQEEKVEEPKQEADTNGKINEEKSKIDELNESEQKGYEMKNFKVKDKRGGKEPISQNNEETLQAEEKIRKQENEQKISENSEKAEKLKQEIEEANKREQESYKTENFKVKDKRHGRETENADVEKTVTKKEDEIHKLENESLKRKEGGQKESKPAENSEEIITAEKSKDVIVDSESNDKVEETPEEIVMEEKPEKILDSENFNDNQFDRSEKEDFMVIPESKSNETIADSENFEKTKVCAKCGKENRGGNNFCTSCGSKFGGEQASEKVEKVVAKEMPNDRFSGVTSFEELFQEIDKEKEIAGSEEIFSATEEKNIINMVRRGEREITAVTRTGGLREKVQDLVDKEKNDKFIASLDQLLGKMPKPTPLMNTFKKFTSFLTKERHFGGSKKGQETSPIQDMENFVKEEKAQTDEKEVVSFGSRELENESQENDNIINIEDLRKKKKLKEAQEKKKMKAKKAFRMGKKPEKNAA